MLGTLINLLIYAFGDRLLRWNVASTLSGTRNDVLSKYGLHAHLPITNSRFQYRHEDSSMEVEITAASEKTVSWQDVNDILKGLFDFLCAGTGSEARRKWLLFDF